MPGETATTTSSLRFTGTEEFACESAWLTAETVTLAGAGRIAGAEYNPVAEIVPTFALPPVTPFTSHVTFVFELPATLA